MPAPLSLIALVFGTAGVWLTIRQTIWCWPVSLVAVVASVAEFYNERLFGDMALQVFYFFAGLYGWIYWKQQSTHTFVVQPTNRPAIPLLVGVTLAQAIMYYYLLVYFKGDRPVLDGLLTACSLTATYMMTRKWIGNWLFWVAIDGAYVFLYGLKGMWLFGILYLFFAVMAFYGWVKWRSMASGK